MKKIAFFDTKKYDIESFDKINKNYKIKYFEDKLNENTAVLAKGCEVVCVFVNDEVNDKVIDILYELGVKVIALRCAGYNNVDIKYAYKKIHIVRVPAYSPYAVAEHAMALLLCLNRRIHKAYLRTRDFNFNIAGLTGFDLHNKTVGVIGTGKIGQAFINICRGFGMNILAYDLYPNPNLDIKYVSLDELYKESDVISLHCPLTDDTKHMIDEVALNKMKENTIIINTSRGALIDSKALLYALHNKKIKGAGLDVYEEESDLFFEDNSNDIVLDDILSLLISLPNVIITSHQGYLTEEALENIASITIKNLDDYFNDLPLDNEVCYHCMEIKDGRECYKNRKNICWK
jgi:D-lactate dehydrogenase